MNTALVSVASMLMMKLLNVLRALISCRFIGVTALLNETLPELRIVRKMSGQDFQCDGAVKARIPS